MTRGRARRLLLLVFAAGALFRFQGLNWDRNGHLHPDERFISMVEEKLSGPKSFRDYLDSKTSRLNPYNVGHGSFVYGTLPMLAAHYAGRAVGKTGYDGTYLVGRTLSGFFDLLSVWLVYRLLRRFASRKTALVGSALLCASPLAIQLSHFWTVDTFLTTFTTAALYGLVRIAQGKSRPGDVLLAGGSLGLAVACKITGLALLAPAGVAVLLGALAPKPPVPGQRIRRALRTLLVGAGILATAALTVRLAFPYAFAGPDLLSFRLDARWLQDVKSLGRLTSSVAAFPPNFQWADRTFLFPLRNIVLWGAAPSFGIPALAGLVWCFGALSERRRRALAPLLLHALILLGYHGFTLVKSIRYFYPAYPVFAVFAALLLERLARAEGPTLLARARRLLPAVAVAGELLCALAFTAVYRREHPRIAASRWIYSNVQPPRPILNETWDDGLPFPQPNQDPGAYSGPQPNIVGPDSAAKVEEIVQALEKADTIAITSNRGYGSLTRLPDVFPMTRAYYRALFEERAGFRLVADFTSYPAFGPLVVPDDSADEAFTVYDHPRVLLFRKTPDFSAARVRSILEAAIPKTPPTLHEWEKWPRSRQRSVSALSPPRRADLPKRDRPADTLAVSSVGAAILWYLALAAVGAFAFPIAFALFPRLEDRGFGLARVLGLALATYAMTVLLTTRTVSNGRGAAWLCLLLLLAAGTFAFLRHASEIRRFLSERRQSLLQSEIVFLVGFGLFLGIRAFNPEIFWGEKPMDFSILNILTRTRHLPPSDPWFAGVPLGYYFFGQEMVVFLTFLTNLATRFTFNLAFGLLGGAILQGAFSLAGNWGRTRRAALAGAALTLLLGNLSGLREWLVAKRSLDWDYFWATSRVVKDTINEYPFWSLVFADLHAHVLAIPLFLLFLVAALHFVRLHATPVASLGRRLSAGLLVGFVAAVQALTNAWDVPLLMGLLLVVPLAALGAGPISLGALGRAGAGFLFAAGSAFLFVRPLWIRGGGSPGMGKNLESGAAIGLDILTVFGLFFFLAFGWWLSAASARLRERGLSTAIRWALVALGVGLLALAAYRAVDLFLAAGVVLFLLAAALLAEEKEDRLAFGLLATAFFLVLFAQRFYIGDRMNTFFKLYLEAWILFAVTTAALAFRDRSRRGAFGTWALPARAAVVLLAAAALFTSVTAGRAAVSKHFAPYSGPSLDGLRYLETLRPGEYRAVLWLNRNVRGTPVVLEAQGPSYQDFGRVSMLTGLPTVLGWDYHVKQRGNPDAQIEARKEAVRAIYTNPDAAAVEPFLRRYHVGYVYVGALERRTYPAAGTRKFRTEPDLFRLVYENPEVQIFRVAGGDTEDVVAPVKEPLPEPAPSLPQSPNDEPEEPPVIHEKPDRAGAPFGGLKEPRGAAVDEKSRIWIADFGHSRIRIFDGEGGFLGGWGGRGNGPFGLREPCAVAVRGDDVFVADTWNGRIQALTTAGKFRATAPGLYGPRGVAAGPDGRVWVSDTGNHRVVSFDRDLGDLQIVGPKGSGLGQFSNPVGIAVGPSGAIYVADADNRRVQVLGKSGEPLRALRFPGWVGVAEPQLAVDSDETLYVSDPGGGAVVVMDPSTGAMRKRLTADEGGRRFDRPTGVAIDPKTRILYVVNSGDGSISRIRLPGGKK